MNYMDFSIWFAFFFGFVNAGFSLVWIFLRRCSVGATILRACFAIVGLLTSLGYYFVLFQGELLILASPGVPTMLIVINTLFLASATYLE